jgi:glycosyltransferase involved in cell wall biosynthesis
MSKDKSETPVILQNRAEFPICNDPVLSVIVCSMNLGKYIRETLNSISNQTFKKYEVIIVDGGSNDGTLKILEEYKNIETIIEKDTGYPDAFWKGLKKARGKYITQCAVSDALADASWFEKAIEKLEGDEKLSLVWALPEQLSENSKPGKIYFSNFLTEKVPEKELFFQYWANTGFFYPEGNLICSRSAALKCYPPLREIDGRILDWIEFSYKFNSQGYLSGFLPMVANYGRVHGGQMGERWEINDWYRVAYKNYYTKIAILRIKLCLGLINFSFVDRTGKKISQLSSPNFALKYISFAAKPKNLYKNSKSWIKLHFPFLKKILTR